MPGDHEDDVDDGRPGLPALETLHDGQGVPDTNWHGLQEPPDLT